MLCSQHALQKQVAQNLADMVCAPAVTTKRQHEEDVNSFGPKWLQDINMDRVRLTRQPYDPTSQPPGGPGPDRPKNLVKQMKDLTFHPDMGPLGSPVPLKFQLAR